MFNSFCRLHCNGNQHGAGRHQVDARTTGAARRPVLKLAQLVGLILKCNFIQLC